MNILVAGAGGYIGIPLCSRLFSEGHKVIALDMFYFGEDKMSSLQENKNFRMVKEDIRTVNPQHFEGVDVVIDLAGLSNDTTAEQNFDIAESINYLGCLHLADLASKHGVKRFIYSSSASVYGAGHSESLTESSPLNPISRYSELKLKTESALLNTYGKAMEITILRNPTLFGVSPRMRFDLALNIMTWRSIRDGRITVHGNGEQWRPLLSVDDVVTAFASALDAPSDIVAGEVFNVGGAESNIRIHDLALLIAESIPGIGLVFEPSLKDARSYNLNFDKIYRLLNFRPQVSHEEGINAVADAILSGQIDPTDPTNFTAEWYRANVFPSSENPGDQGQ
ncbi:MAG: SDR family oxidoreductase [Candidatus Marinimicrobia bacterium]|nr:SDR family oxidoreductase [Candidatus Neomarinimicrobiota bacterium]